jgi:hypothetical protein
MDINNSILLNRVFTRNTLKDLIECNCSETYTAAIRRHIVDPEQKSNRQLISEIYQVLNKGYRNEYYYKNTLLNKLLLGVHSPKTTTALTEIPISKSKADFILINGKAVVYEIKTELDNFERLKSQIYDYYKAFSYVAVVTGESNHAAVQKKLEGTPVGIYLLTRRNKLSEKKKPLEFTSQLNQEIMFKILRKSEYEAIIQSYYKRLPSVSQFEYYRCCKKLFCEIDLFIAYKLFLDALKKRTHVDIELYASVPYELRFLMYFSNNTLDYYRKLDKFLEGKGGNLCTSHT